MGDITRDLRHALRLSRKNPAITAIILLALALGIGANTVIFSAFNTVMLRPLPYTDPERIVTVWDSFPQAGIKKFGVTYANFIDMKERNHVFEPLALYVAASNTTFNLTGIAGPERVQGTRATGDFFRAMGVQPLMGRTVMTEDEQQGRGHVVVLGYNLWQRDFGGNPRIIGSSIKLNDEDYNVLGVMPQGFEFPSGAEMPPGQQFASATELWVPLTTPVAGVERTDRSGHSYRAVGRLKPGVTIEQAQADVRAVAQQLVAEHPVENDGLSTAVTTLRENQVGELRPAMLALLASVGFVLLIACANIANLLLSRAAVRQKEFAIRAALGASRRRILQQLLTESVLLSVTGGLLGLLLSVIATRTLVAYVPTNIPRINEVSVDFRVLLFTMSISLLTGILFGMAPALHASKSDLHEGVKEGGRSVSAGVGQNRLRNMLLISEVILVFVLLIAAGLMLKSFGRLLNVTPGFDPQNVLTARVTLPSTPYPAQKKRVFYHQLVDRLEEQPGVEAAAVIRDLPLSGTDPRYGFKVEGRSDEAQDGGYSVRYRIISPGYFKAMGIPLKQGRYFDEHDDENGAGVAIINESAARTIWPGQNPIGQVVVTDGGLAREKCVIVGIVGDIKFGGLDTQPDPEMFIPYPQLPEKVMQAAIGSMAVVVRGKGNPTALVADVRRQVAAIDKDVPVSSVFTMNELLANSLSSRRFNLLLLVIFAGVALLLAAVGIYGVLSYWVSQRTREIGIRMALGAQRTDIFKLVIFQAMSLVLIGLGIGLGAALLLGRVLSGTFSGLLFGVSAFDPLTFVSVTLVLAAVALLACYVPARRAVRVEPTIALRYE
jgi:putative ABC transport system permease protein